ncbi:HAD family hydrolase [Streptomyces sp. NPDC052115]
MRLRTGRRRARGERSRRCGSLVTGFLSVRQGPVVAGVRPSTGIHLARGRRVRAFRRPVRQPAQDDLLRPGAAAALDALESHGVRQSVVSGNIRAVAELKLRFFGLDQHID